MAFFSRGLVYFLSMQEKGGEDSLGGNLGQRCQYSSGLVQTMAGTRQSQWEAWDKPADKNKANSM